MDSSPSRFILTLTRIRRHLGVSRPQLTRFERSSVLNYWSRLPPASKGTLVGAGFGLAAVAASAVENKLYGDNPLTGRVLPYATPFFSSLVFKSLWIQRHRADIDPLTGVLRREPFGDWISMQQRALRKGAFRTVLFGDLDNFKVSNDILGKTMGDKILARFGRACIHLLRAHDVVARPGPKAAGRWGGDEFVVGGAFDEDQGHAIAERLSKVVDAIHRDNVMSFAAQRDQESDPNVRRELDKKLSMLLRFPLRLSIIPRQLRPGETLDGIKEDLDSKLKVVKERRAPSRERAF